MSRYQSRSSRDGSVPSLARPPVRRVHASSAARASTSPRLTSARARSTSTPSLGGHASNGPGNTSRTTPSTSRSSTANRASNRALTRRARERAHRASVASAFASRRGGIARRASRRALPRAARVDSIRRVARSSRGRVATPPRASVETRGNARGNASNGAALARLDRAREHRDERKECATRIVRGEDAIRENDVDESDGGGDDDDADDGSDDE